MIFILRLKNGYLNLREDTKSKYYEENINKYFKNDQYFKNLLEKEKLENFLKEFLTFEEYSNFVTFAMKDLEKGKELLFQENLPKISYENYFQRCNLFKNYKFMYIFIKFYILGLL